SREDVGEIFKLHMGGKSKDALINSVFRTPFTLAPFLNRFFNLSVLFCVFGADFRPYFAD
ncbi:MAG: hypothetical protein ACOH2T_26460, partial [Pseudomonas sp.]